MYRQSEPYVHSGQYDERQQQGCCSKQGSLAVMSGRELLKYVDQRYGHPDIIVTENGVDVPGEASLPLPDALHDTFRINYTQAYLDQVSPCDTSPDFPLAKVKDKRVFMVWHHDGSWSTQKPLSVGQNGVSMQSEQVVWAFLFKG